MATPDAGMFSFLFNLFLTNYSIFFFYQVLLNLLIHPKCGHKQQMMMSHSCHVAGMYCGPWYTHDDVSGNLTTTNTTQYSTLLVKFSIFFNFY